MTPALLDFEAVCARVGRPATQASRLYFWRGAKAGTFPVPVQLSAARIAWRADEIEAWISSRPRAPYGEAA